MLISENHHIDKHYIQIPYQDTIYITPNALRKEKPNEVLGYYYPQQHKTL